MNPEEARQFVRYHGVVLASAKGSLPNLAEAVVGEAIRGSWWGHREGKRIFAALSAVEEDPDVLVCRLIDDKKTFVHSRLWPALVRCAAHLPTARLARTRERHTAAGKHMREDIAFPAWVPLDVSRSAALLNEKSAWRELYDAGAVLEDAIK